jgi:SH3-like domain-containing protein
MQRKFTQAVYQMRVTMTKVTIQIATPARDISGCSRLAAVIIFFQVICAAMAGAAFAEDVAGRKPGKVTGLPVPRFVSLKADEVNARVGPGSDYAIAWVFRRAGLPVEILAEFENWRQVRDSSGGTGWVAASLVSGRRTALVAPWIKGQTLFQLSSSRSGSSAVAQMEPGAIVDISECDGESCEVYAGKKIGWVPQKNLWGVYPRETVN